jgi:hypothetical protein
MIAATSGGLGDIIYSIPVLRKLGVDTLYVKESYYFEPYGNLYSAIKRLLLVNGINALPTDGGYPPMEYDPNLVFDYDLDIARNQKGRRVNHIMVSYHKAFNLPADGWCQPWLEVPGESNFKPPYSVNQLTNRWRKGSKVKWREVVKQIENPVFLGFDNEYEDFCLESRTKHIPFIETEDVYQMALIIRDSEAVYCNQSVGLTISQGLGNTYFLDKNPHANNAIMRTKNENIL